MRRREASWAHREGEGGLMSVMPVMEGGGLMSVMLD